ncbi:MAG: hypothetical protein HRF46_06215 [Acidobacteriota bacterium]|jgi:hypothetical protein
MRKIAIAAVLVFAVIVATWAVFLGHDKPRLGTDDANISFSYAENLARGHGIAYGATQQRVEGYTSTLWMLLCALSFAIGLDELGVLWLSIAVLCSTLAVALSLVRHYTTMFHVKSWPYELTFIALVLSSPGYVTWTTITLMDTCLWGLFVVGLL